MSQWREALINVMLSVKTIKKSNFNQAKWEGSQEDTQAITPKPTYKSFTCNFVHKVTLVPLLDL